jgi:hypothetical protein
MPPPSFSRAAESACRVDTQSHVHTLGNAINTIAVSIRCVCVEREKKIDRV